MAKIVKNNIEYPVVTVGTAIFPEIVALKTSNRRAGQTLSHTFSEAGAYQYYAVIKFGDVGGSATDFSITLNGVALTPIGSYSNAAYLILYGEVSVSANDILSASPTNTHNDTNGGIQLHILKNADIFAFDWLGYAGNNYTTFNIINSGISLEVYLQGYYNWRNTCYSQLIAGNNISVPVPNIQDFYYGGTFAIKVT